MRWSTTLCKLVDMTVAMSALLIFIARDALWDFAANGVV